MNSANEYSDSSLAPDVTLEISGWGNSHTSSCKLSRPAARNHLLKLLSRSGPNGLITRGCGRSYGDQATNANGHVIDTTSLTQIESFDAQAGLLVCESGVTLNSLIDHYMPRGFVPAVCPGTGFVTVGGAIANDVHGKNHYANGSFGDHVEWLELMSPSGEIHRVSRQINSELFGATIGGIGLTGLILKAAIRLAPVPSRSVTVTDYRINDLTQFMAMLEDKRKTSPHTVGWIDATARGRKMGRGILSCAQSISDSMTPRTRRKFTIPFRTPQFLLNRHSVRLFNMLYFNRVRSARTKVQDFSRFVFPLDAILRWNRLYGNKGVFQFQCVIPFDSAPAAIPELMLAATSSSHSSPLAVLKTLSHEGSGMLSFPRAGYTLALDLPRTTETKRLISKMYDIAIHNDGRAYLAKDACLEADQFRKMYDTVDRFLRVLAKTDPEERMVSDMARRLELRT